MKHAFLFATNIYISNHRVFSYFDGENDTVFLTIHHFYDKHNPAGGSLLIDADINTVDDHHPVKIVNNIVETGADVSIVTEPNRVKVYHAGNAQPILDVYQLDQHEYHGLSSHILNEIHSQHPDPVVTIKGNFNAGGAHIHIENEKLFIDDESYANGVVNAHDGIRLSHGEEVHQ